MLPGAAYGFYGAASFLGDNDWADESENGRIRLCIYAAFRHEPRFLGSYLGTRSVPGRSPRIPARGVTTSTR